MEDRFKNLLGKGVEEAVDEKRELRKPWRRRADKTYASETSRRVGIRLGSEVRHWA